MHRVPSLSKDNDQFDPEGIWGEFAGTVKPNKKSKVVARPSTKPKTLIKPPSDPIPETSPIVEPAKTAPTPQRRRGKTPEIAAQLDLHGFTQELAYKRLCDFIHSCIGKNIRHILVVTGKGNPLTGTGVIQKELPRWCGTPALSPLVVSCSFAPPQLGGKGAYILHLRVKKHRPTD